LEEGANYEKLLPSLEKAEKKRIPIEGDGNVIK
jgi:hypothetical protein